MEYMLEIIMVTLIIATLMVGYMYWHNDVFHAASTIDRDMLKYYNAEKYKLTKFDEKDSAKKYAYHCFPDVRLVGNESTKAAFDLQVKNAHFKIKKIVDNINRYVRFLDDKDTTYTKEQKEFVVKMIGQAEALKNNIITNLPDYIKSCGDGEHAFCNGNTWDDNKGCECKSGKSFTGLTDGVYTCSS